jgi:CDP-glucose 4,6-dehydratase
MGGWGRPLESMGLNTEFWRGRKVLLTGHTGFKGSWLSIWLKKLGADLTGYSLSPPTDPSLFHQARVSDGMVSVIGDIRDFEHISSVVEKSKPEVIIHMAAQSLVRKSYQDPLSTYSINVMGTVHILEAIRSAKSVKAFVNVTTDKCYQNKEWMRGGYRESDAMGGFDPYSNSKGCSELITESYRSSFFNSNKFYEHGVAIASARAGNVIGGGDWATDRLIPDILSSFHAQKSANIRNPFAIRPWQHVLEPLRGYLMLAQNLVNHGSLFAEGWNFGPTDEDARPVEWIAGEMCRLWGQNATWSKDLGPHPHEATHLKLDITKAREKLKWAPLLRLHDALEMIVEWEHLCLNGKDPYLVTSDQISKYMNLN